MKRCVILHQLAAALLRDSMNGYPVDFVEHTLHSIFAAERGDSKLTSEILGLAGFSSPRMRHFLNNVCSFPSVNYLEIGTWKGSTLLSASYLNSGQFTGIDNFSQFGDP